MLVCGLLVPAHLRAVDVSVIQRAGRNTPALIEQGLALVNENKLVAAQLLLQAAQSEKLTGLDKLGLAITNSARRHPGWLSSWPIMSSPKPASPPTSARKNSLISNAALPG
jgi:hypothetical protein